MMPKYNVIILISVMAMVARASHFHAANSAVRPLFLLAAARVTFFMVCVLFMLVHNHQMPHSPLRNNLNV